MDVIHEINLDMIRSTIRTVDMMQGDASSRKIKINLYSDGVPWTPPTGWVPIIRYQKTDNLGGFYDVDDNGESAVSISGSTITIIVCLQALTTVGHVAMSVNFYSPRNTKVSTFAFTLNVKENPMLDRRILSGNYYNALTDLASSVVNAAASLPDDVGQYVSDWLDENITITSGVTIDTSLRVSGAAADSKAAGDAIANVNANVANLGDGYSSLQGGGLFPAGLFFNEGGYIGSDGGIVPYSNWKYTDFIDVSASAGRRIYLSSTGTDDLNYNSIYNSDHEQITRIRADVGDYILSENAHYMRLSCRSASNMTLKLYSQGIINAGKDPIVFELGSYNNDGVNTSSTTRLRTPFIKVDPNVKYLLTPASGYSAYLTYFDENKAPISSMAYSADSRVVWPANKAYYIRLLLKNASDDSSPINLGDLSMYETKLEKLPILHARDYLKVLTFNVGKWTDGSQPGLQPEEIPERSIAWHRFLGDFNPDIFCAQEGPWAIDAAQTVSAYNTLMRFKLAYTYIPASSTGTYAKQMPIYSKYNYRNVHYHTFESESTRPCLCFDMDINGKTINFMVVHLSLEASSTGVRQQDLAELATLLGACEYGVLMGDFNAYTTSEFTTYFANFNRANCGDFGEFATWRLTSPTWTNQAIDNIITTTNISIQNVRLGSDITLSDHRPLMAELEIY